MKSSRLIRTKMRGRIAKRRAFGIQHALGIEDNAIELKQFKTFNPL